MSLAQTINYDTAGNFSFDATKIQIGGGKASLKLIANPGLSFSQAFGADTGFTYDSTKAEFTAGVLRQKAQRPNGATFGARWDSFIDANWADGDTTAVITGSPSIFGSKLQMTGGGRFVAFDAALSAAPLAAVGCVRLRITPAYNGTPSANQVFFDLYNSDNSGKNRITLFHATNGSFFILLNDSDGVNQVSSSVGAFVAVAGTEIEIEMSWDLNAGKIRFFGEGFLVSDMDVSFSRDTNVDTIQTGDADADFSIRDLVFFDAVQHTASYTAHEYTLPAGDFVESSATLPAFSYTDPGSVEAFTAFSSTVIGTPRFILASKYWTGSAWATSDGTYAEASPHAAVAAHIATLTPASTLTVEVVFGDGNTRGSIDALAITYTGQIYPTDDPSIEPSTTIGIDGLDGFSSIEGGTGSVRYQLRLSGNLYFWNGSAWAASDGSYAQASTAAAITANREHASLTSLTSAGVTLRPRALLHSVDGQASPDLTTLTILYNFFASSPAALAECVIYAHARDLLGDVPGSDPKLIITLEELLFHGVHTLLPSSQTVDADEDGRFELSVVETATVTRKYLFEITYLDGDGVTQTIELGRSVAPNQSSANLSELTFVT